MCDCPVTTAADACKYAVRQAYMQLRRSGIDESEAFRSALNVLRLRHKNLRPNDAGYLVASWLAAEGDEMLATPSA